MWSKPSKIDTLHLCGEIPQTASIEISESRCLGMIPEFGPNALQVLQRRYLLRDERGQIIESPAQLFRRVAMTIAPTGTISIIANCSSGIEPLFAISYIRNVMDDTKMLESNPYFESIAKEEGFYSKNLIEEISRRGTIQHIKTIPKKIRQTFVTAHDISPLWHIRMQAAFQKHTDNAVSKTINLPHDAKQKDVSDAFWLVQS